MSQLARLLRPVLLAFALLAPLQAQAFQITVSGVTYELSTVITSYDTSSALLQLQPWWTGTADATLASTFANAFLSAGGNTGPDLSASNAFFAYETTPGITESIRVSGTTNRGGASERTDVAVPYVTATVVPAVPEIGGNALPKALFILFTLWLWLQVRRRKGQAHAKTA